LRQILQHPGVEVLVVDDASPDGTAGIVEDQPEFGSRIHLLRRAGKLGLASAYKEGFAWALQRNFDAVLEIDADLSHDPRDIGGLIAALNEGADLAVGSRYLDGVRVLNWPQHRLFLSLFAGAYTRFFTALPMSDPTSGFKAIRREVLEAMDWRNFEAEGYGFQIELHLRAWHGNFVLKEIPIVFTERRAGASKMSRQIAWEAAGRVLQLAFEKSGGKKT
jgi:dolichol-phosphate mannosyltransferase